jgi:hypothetical protein
MVDDIGSMAIERLHVYRQWRHRLLGVASRCRQGVDRWHRLTLGHGRLSGPGSQLGCEVMLVGSVGRMAGYRRISSVLREGLETYRG